MARLLLLSLAAAAAEQAFGAVMAVMAVTVAKAVMIARTAVIAETVNPMMASTKPLSYQPFWLTSTPVGCACRCTLIDSRVRVDERLERQRCQWQATRIGFGKQ